VDDDRYMVRALALAARGRGRTSPNPMVGAVVVDAGGRVVGEGYHERAGAAHAEIRALAEAGGRARGATLYCTLEPCAHTGRTGPCAAAVAEAGIARVVVATRDPNPLVAGRGLAYLRARGIEVIEGVRAREAARLNVAFFTAMTRRRPWVVLKVATSLDARVSARPGERTRLTSDEADALVHALRADVDAIVVGSETVLVDDPRLTARGTPRERPLLRVVLDGRLRTPPGARLFDTLDHGPVVVVSTEEAVAARPEHAARLSAAGAEIVTAPHRDIAAALAVLHAREIRAAVVEGGPTVHRAALEAGVVDRVQVFVTPAWLGRRGVPWDVPGWFSLAGLEQTRVVPCGPDVLLEGDVHRVD
jgi:diaminohydroxyphosphoribosylaminopyrimidine deaminase/5-amino-6-(5-phosphoribosylamino)uracil reductase